MEEKSQIITKQLKETCELTNAYWAVWIERIGTNWFFRYHHGLNKTKLQVLQALLKETEISTRITGGLATGRTCSFKTKSLQPDLTCQTIFIYPEKNSQSVLLVGADALEKKSQRFFKL